MTEHRSRKTRWPKGRVRALAWGTGGAAFVLAAAPLVAAPKPPVDAAASARRAPARRVIEPRPDSLAEGPQIGPDLLRRPVLGVQPLLLIAL